MGCKENNLAYAVGLIATDGNLASSGRHISLVSKDIEQIENFLKTLEINSLITLHKSSFNPKGKYYWVQFSSVNLYRFLVGIGLTPNKSLTLGKLSIPDEYFTDFLRGVIDGDGNISTWIHRTNLHPQWCFRIFSASYEFINWLKVVIEKKFEVKGGLYKAFRKDRKIPTYTLKFGKKAAITILEKTYYNNCIALTRKYNQVQLCLQSTDKMVN